MPRRSRSVAIVVLLASAVALGAAQRGATGPQAPPPSQSSTNAALSPVVEGGWFTTVQPSGGALLDLLVLWRGTPGWHLGGRGGSGGRSTGGASGGLQRLSIARSGMPVLTAVLDRLSKSCEIQGKQVPLGDHNVVLVYVADSDASVKIEKTLRVDPVLPSSRQIEVAIRRSPEIIEFLRCDAKLPDPRYQRTIDAMCARYSGG